MRIAVIVILGVGELVIAQMVFDLQSSVRRADMSILMESQTSDAHGWFGFMYIMFKGYLCNEGSRMAIIERFEISQIYNSSENHKMSFVIDSTDVCSDFGWDNACLGEQEARPFLVNLFIERIEDARGGLYVWKYWRNGILHTVGTFNVRCSVRGSQNSLWKFLGNYTIYDDLCYPMDYVKKPTEIRISVGFNDGISHQEKTQRFTVS